MGMILDDLTVENSVTLSGGAVGTPSSLTPDLSNAAGSATSISRSDHIHNVPTAAASSQTPDQSNAQGSALTFARADHVHNIATAAATGLNAGSTNTQGTATSFARSDHTHAIASGVVSSLTPNQANAAGTSTNFARADHIHNVPTAAPIAQTPDNSNADGSAATFSRSDHIHNIATAAAVTISSNANAQGAASNFARSNHTHQLTAGAAALDSIPQFDNTNWQAVLPEQWLNPSKAWYKSDDFFTSVNTSGTVIGELLWGWNTGGGASSVAPDNTNVTSNHPGICRILAGNAGGNTAGMVLNSTNFIVLGGGTVYSEWLINITALATVANDYTIRIGMGDSTTADFTNGAYFQYTRGTSVNWLIKTAASATRTSTTTTTAVATGWVKLGISVNAAGTSINFTVNGTSVGTITTNIPSAATNFAAHQTRTAGTPSAFDIDYFLAYQRFTTAR